MTPTEYHSFRKAIAEITHHFPRKAMFVPPHIWQGIDVSTKPEMGTYEVEDTTFTVPTGTFDLQYFRDQIGPNVPWADEHFILERVSGQPINPGETWKIWPWGHSADKFRTENGQYNHSYAERYWPKHAGKTPGGTWPEGATIKSPGQWGIRYAYGDLGDVVQLLIRNPLTRNAYLPVWFPEDTGVVHGGRTPCSLGYLFRMRGDHLSIHYDIRSCDLKRHFRDDIYLTVRLLLWVLEKCRSQDSRWLDVQPGKFTMHIGSLHVFKNDWREMFNEGRVR